MVMDPGFISRRVLLESCSPLRKDDSGILNHVFSKPEAQDIRVSVSRLESCLTEGIAADSGHGSGFHLAMGPP